MIPNPLKYDSFSSIRMLFYPKNYLNLSFLSIQKIQQLGLLMPGRSEKSEIIMGMKDTFQNRQVARQKQISVAEILQQFPHLASYDGEIVSLSP